MSTSSTTQVVEKSLTTIVFQKDEALKPSIRESLRFIITERLENNDFPGGTIICTFVRARRSKTPSISNLKWVKTAIPSEVVLIKSEIHGSQAFQCYLTPQKNAKEQFQSAGSKRTLKDFLSEPIVRLAPKTGPGLSMILDGACEHAPTPLDLLRNGQTLPSPPVVQPQAKEEKPTFVHPEQKFERIPFSIEEFTPEFEDKFLEFFLEIWKATSREKKCLVSMLECSHLHSMKVNTVQKTNFLIFA